MKDSINLLRLSGIGWGIGEEYLKHRVVDSRRTEFRSIDASLDTLKRDTFFSAEEKLLFPCFEKKKDERLMKEHRVVNSRRVEFRSIDASLDPLKRIFSFRRKTFIF